MGWWLKEVSDIEVLGDPVAWDTDEVGVPPLQLRESLHDYDLDRVDVKLIFETDEPCTRHPREGERLGYVWAWLVGAGTERQYLGVLQDDSYVIKDLKRMQLVEFGPEHIFRFTVDPADHSGSLAAANMWLNELVQVRDQPLTLLHTFRCPERRPVEVRHWRVYGPCFDAESWLVFWMECSREFSPCVRLCVGDFICASDHHRPIIAHIPPRQSYSLVLNQGRIRMFLPPAWVKLWGWKLPKEKRL